MRPVDFFESNRVFAKPAGMTDEECGPLHVHDTGGALISCWLLTREELEEVQRTGRVWLWVHGRGHPPVSVEAMSPFEAAPARARTSPAASEEAVSACTGLTARWCPIHGDCTCEGESLDGHGCPLHSAGSEHAEPAPAAQTPPPQVHVDDGQGFREPEVVDLVDETREVADARP